MTESKNYRGLGIGIIFTIGSLLLSVTYIIPVISILPGVLVEEVSARLISNEPYSNVGKLTILILSILLLLWLAISLLNIRMKAKSGPVSKGRIVAIMFIFYFLVHSLGFYCYLGINLNFRNDGQLLFGAASSFPVSSCFFVLIGLLLDVVKNKAAHANIATMQAI